MTEELLWAEVDRADAYRVLRDVVLANPRS
jgi:hypothetical protein